MSTTIHATAIPDEEYARLLLKAQKNPNGFYIHDKEMRQHKFFMKGDEMWGSLKGEEYLTMTMTEALAKKAEMEARAPPSFKDDVVRKMKADFPNMTEDEIDANADIINEANDSIKRLISAGIAPDAAYKIITGALQSDDMQNLVIRELSKEQDTKNDS